MNTNIAEFLHDLTTNGIQVWPDGQQLRYSAPDNRLTSEVFGKLKERKSELLTYWHSSETHPLSYGQRGLWFDCQLTSNTDNNVSCFARIGSVLDIDRLRVVFQQLVSRHPALRTTFEVVQGEPVQRIHHYQPIAFTQIDASQWNEQILQTELVAYHRLQFDLELGPLFRVALFTRRDDEHVLLFAVHHLLVDGLSLAIIIQELRALYLAIPLPTTRSVRLPALTPYKDYVTWQNKMVTTWQNKMVTTEGAAARDFWHGQLAGELPLLDLPTDRPYPSVRIQPGAAQVVEITEGLTEQLRTLAREEGVTLYTLMLAAYQVFLHRYTGQDDLLVGSVAAGRHCPEFAGVVGYLAAPFVVRVALRGEMSFRTLLKEVWHYLSAVLTHQGYPFPLLVEELQPPRILGRLPIFQANFLLQRLAGPDSAIRLVRDLRPEALPYALDWDGLRLSQFAIFQEEALYDLSLQLSDMSDNLAGLFKYSPDLFDAATVARMADHLQTLLAGIIENPDQLIAKLPMLTEGERGKLLVEWNNPPVAWGQAAGPAPAEGKCVHQLFEEQVVRTPDAIAIVFDEQQLTYAELNVRANQLAHYLQEIGVVPGQVVGLCLPASIDLIVSILGVLKAGGAYTPLDPAYPADRLQRMVTGAKLGIVISQKTLALALPGAVHLLSLAQEWGRISRYPMTNPQSAVTSNDLIYMIYTSGSTGQPKGAGVYHRGFMNLLDWFVKEFQFGAQDRVLITSSPSFDLTQKNFYAPLLVGGTLYLSQAAPYEYPQMRSLIAQHQITWLNCAPSAFYPFLEPADEYTYRALASLRYLFLGGEPIALERLWPWLQAQCCQAKLVNTYGPTECTDIATSYVLDHTALRSQQMIPIGKGIPNARLYVLDRHLELAPIGVPGELYIGGAGVGAGYLNDKELTEQKFIVNPFVGVGDPQLYKTGDLVRWLPDGNIEYLGRIDQQVKLRGFRIELGEIESALSQHAAVQEAVVIAREDTPGQKYLVAYIVADKNSGLDEVSSLSLRSYLQMKVPDYMVPSAFVRLDTLPLSPNGKVNRKALPLPVDVRNDKAAVAPACTPVEKKMVKLWEELLGIHPIGIYDNFFELGGHSLLAVQLAANIEQSFQQEFRLRSLFMHPTIATLADVLY